MSGSPELSEHYTQRPVLEKLGRLDPNRGRRRLTLREWPLLWQRIEGYEYETVEPVAVGIFGVRGCGGVSSARQGECRRRGQAACLVDGMEARKHRRGHRGRRGELHFCGGRALGCSGEGVRHRN